MDELSAEGKWQVRMIRPGMPGLNRLPDLLGLPELSRLPGMGQPVRPADIGEGLRAAMLDRENMLEDVNYQKVVPNQFIVEVSPADYQRQFRPIEIQVVEQWREQLLDDLITANSRQGRKEFRLGGRLQIQVRAAPGLKDTEARVLSRIEQDRPAGHPQTPAGARPVQSQDQRAARSSASVSGRAETLPGTPPEPASAEHHAYLELAPSGRRWALIPGINTIGRSETNQIYLDQRDVQEKRLVSGQHAHIIMDQGDCFLYDGSANGKPSSNGTYVNLRRVPPQGYHLQNGDAIILAAVDPQFPRSDTTGVATFYFWAGRRT